MSAKLCSLGWQSSGPGRLQTNADIHVLVFSSGKHACMQVVSFGPASLVF